MKDTLKKNVKESVLDNEYMATESNMGKFKKLYDSIDEKEQKKLMADLENEMKEEK